MITIPVLEQHDQTRVIGHLTIDETRLPLFPNYVFTLGYRFTGEIVNWDATKHSTEKGSLIVTELLGPHELCEVSLTLDADYIAYLQQIGKIPPAPTTENLNATIEALQRDLDTALGMLAGWCVAVDENGSSWDGWDEHYKDVMYRDGPIRAMLDKAITEARNYPV